ncbi:MAG TPA: hypothetical protein PLZ15_04630 [Melioribacteraceae bacterium]|nr:hypothetical protein [Melioribacteraceae bacterium]
MKKYILLFAILPLILLGTGCSAQNIFKAEPIDEKEVYNGREIITKEMGDVIISVEFDGQSENDFVYYVEIMNRSGEIILVNPAGIFAKAVDRNLSETEEYFGTMRAADPERELMQINREKESRKTIHSVATGLNAAFALLSIIGNLSDDDTRNDGAKVVHDVFVWADNQAREEIDYSESMKHLESQRKFWKNEVLRKTELKPDDSVGGLVFIPFNPEIKFLRLTVPAGNLKFDFYFKQIQVE